MGAHAQRGALRRLRWTTRLLRPRAARRLVTWRRWTRRRWTPWRRRRWLASCARGAPGASRRLRWPRCCARLRPQTPLRLPQRRLPRAPRRAQTPRRRAATQRLPRARLEATPPRRRCAACRRRRFGAQRWTRSPASRQPTPPTSTAAREAGWCVRHACQQRRMCPALTLRCASAGAQRAAVRRRLRAVPAPPQPGAQQLLRPGGAARSRRAARSAHRRRRRRPPGLPLLARAAGPLATLRPGAWRRCIDAACIRGSIVAASQHSASSFG